MTAVPAGARSGNPDPLEEVRATITEAAAALRDALGALGTAAPSRPPESVDEARQLLRMADAAPSRALECLDDARQLVTAGMALVVVELRRRGRTWEEVGGVLQISKQAAHERFAKLAAVQRYNR